MSGGIQFQVPIRSDQFKTSMDYQLLGQAPVERAVWRKQKFSHLRLIPDTIWSLSFLLRRGEQAGEGREFFQHPRLLKEQLA